MGVISTKENFDKALGHIETRLKILKDNNIRDLSYDAQHISGSLIALQITNLSIGRDLYLQLERISQKSCNCKE